MNTVDVRTIIPRERHPLLFDTFDALQPGESFDERPSVLGWHSLQQGPEVWRVQVGRSAS